MGLELTALIKLHLTMHAFLWIFRITDRLSISKHLLKDYTTGCIYGVQKRGMYSVQQAMSCSELTIVRL